MSLSVSGTCSSLDTGLMLMQSLLKMNDITTSNSPSTRIVVTTKCCNQYENTADQISALGSSCFIKQTKITNLGLNWNMPMMAATNITTNAIQATGCSPVLGGSQCDIHCLGCTLPYVWVVFVHARKKSVQLTKFWPLTSLVAIWDQTVKINAHPMCLVHSGLYINSALLALDMHQLFLSYYLWKPKIIEVHCVQFVLQPMRNS